MNITINVISEAEQRGCVSGCDWQFDSSGDLNVSISPLSDWRREVLLGVHEAVEAVMCKQAGITQQQVDEFDVAFDKAHPDEPDLGAGDDPAAPYFRQHVAATAIESILCTELGVNWDDYMNELGSKYPGPSKR